MPGPQIHDPTRSNTQQGTGLGLPLTKAMAELHGGDLMLVSDTGMGTEVTIRFPRNRVRVKPTEKSGKAAIDMAEPAE